MNKSILKWKEHDLIRGTHLLYCGNNIVASISQREYGSLWTKLQLDQHNYFHRYSEVNEYNTKKAKRRAEVMFEKWLVAGGLTLEPDWTSTSEQMPDEGEVCQLYHPKSGDVIYGYYSSAFGWMHDQFKEMIAGEISHYKPRPEPPKQGANT